MSARPAPDDSSPRRWLRWLWILTVAGVGVALVVVALSGPDEPPPSQSVPADASVPTASVAAAEGRAPGPESAHTLAGARTAGLHYLALSESVLAMSDAAAADAQREAASSGSADRLVGELTAKLAALHKAYPAGVAYRVGPIATRVAGVGTDAARAEIYYVGIVSPAGVAPYEEWRLARYDLVWERGAWRVAAESSGPGPRPAAPVQPEPASAAMMTAALDGFASVAAAS